MGFSLGVCWRMFPSQDRLGSEVPPGTGSEEETTPPARLSVLIIPSKAGGQRRVLGVEGPSRVRRWPADPADALPEPTTRRPQTAMPVSSGDEGTVLAGAACSAPGPFLPSLRCRPA